MRLFIGIDLPDEMKESIEQTLLPLQQNSKGWEKSHDYHQTLLFIGSVENEKAAEIEKRMSEISFHPFTLLTRGFSFFNRRIMYVDFHPSDNLIRLKKEIDLKFPEYLRPDEKEFVPHVTVKRWQRYEFDQLAEGILEHALPSLKFEVNELCLFKSERDQNNFKYHVISKIPFEN